MSSRDEFINQRHIQWSNEQIQPHSTKEKMMQKLLKQFMLVGVVSLFLTPVVALSQDWSQIKITQEQAEEYAKMIYKKDINAGKLSLQQAGAYFKCSEEDYAVNLSKSPDAEKYATALERMQQLDEMSASEKAKYDAEMKALNEAAEKLRSQSQDKCVKQLGLKTKPQPGI
jgi:hypothetical protein